MMPQRFSDGYRDALFASGDSRRLTELCSVITSSQLYDPERPDYGLVPEAFMIVESLTWLAQAVRSGIVTYYEATASSTQQSMLEVLQQLAAPELAEYYELGMAAWEEERKASVIDAWAMQNDQKNHDSLMEFARQNKVALERYFL